MDTFRKIKTSDFFTSHPVFTLDEAVEGMNISRGRAGAIDRLKYYLKTGRLKLVTRGVYAVVPSGASVMHFQPDLFLVAGAVRKDAIFSYHSALELAGVGHSVWNRCTVCCMKRRNPVTFKGGSIHFMQDPAPFAGSELRYLGTRKVERRGILLATTGPERTLIDGFRRSALCGGVEEIVLSAGGFPVLDLDLLIEILRNYNIARLWAAAGWFLEHFQERFHVPESVLLQIEKKRPVSAQYLERDRRGGLLSPRWNLILTESIIKGNRLYE